MNDMVLLIDFENVRDVKFTDLPPQAQVRVFVGKSQNNIPFSITSEAQPLGERLRWIKIDGDGRNNLDFHLTFYLGLLAREFEGAEFVILSKDKGFDPLIEHIARNSLLRCRRIGSLTELTIGQPEPPDIHFERAYEVLAKLDKKAQPKKRKTLTQQVSSTFQKKLPSKEVQRIVELFFSKGLITESNNSLTYNF